jgi:hypothetical protein
LGEVEREEEAVEVPSIGECERACWLAEREGRLGVIREGGFGVSPSVFEWSLADVWV